MIRLLDVDLEQPRPVLEATVEPTWIVVRAGGEVLGHAMRMRLSERDVAELWDDLWEKFGSRGYARWAIRPATVPQAAEASDVTLIVCTRDRSDLLEGWLEATAQLNPPPGDVLVVDNAPRTDATRALAERYGVRYVLEPTPGLDHARNRGWREATTPIVAYVDDDARVEPHFATAIGGGFLAPNIALVTGLVLPAELETHAQVVLERDVAGFRLAGYERRVFHARLAPVGFRTFQMGAGANMAFRRDVLDTLGGFDPRLDVGTRTRGGGDLDMFFRILEAGYVALFEPRAVVSHIHRRTTSELIRQMEDWGIAFSAFLAKRRIGPPPLRREVARHLRRELFEVFVRQPLKLIRERRPLHLRMVLTRGWGTLRGRAALRAETAANPAPCRAVQRDRCA